MKFDNHGFESGVKTTLNSLKTLHESLKMKGATNGLAEVDKSIKSVGASGFSSLSSSIDAVSSKFSALGVIGMTALANITNSAVNAGKSLVKSFTLDPIKSGFSEYETKINAIQTILTNTASKGTKLSDVTKALNELNLYADKTIYNFAEMTRNIGTFTAAGVDLDTAVQSIKGIANLGAGSGSSPQQVATAMYQLSQAMAAGKVSLMDWNSVVNAGMGGEMFQKALIDTAKGMGKVVDAGKPFRETLQDGWLTSEVLTKTLQKFADDPSLVQAATQVKTLSGLIDTMKESVQSGWAQSMEYIFGNKDQAAKLFTGISDGFNKIIGPSTDARNEMLKFWNEAGGRDDVIKGLGNILNGVGKGLGAIGKAWKEVFPPMTGKKLVELSKGFKDLTEKFKMSDKTAGMIKNTFKGLFSVFDFGKNAVMTVVKSLIPFGSVFGSIGKVVLTATSSIGKFFQSINQAAKSSGIFDKIVNGVKKGVDNIGKFLDNAAKGVEKFFQQLASLNFKPIFDFVSQVGSGIGKSLESVFGGLGEMISKINFNSIIGAIGAIAAGKGLGKIESIGKTFKGAFDSIFGITENVSNVLDSVRETLEAYQNNLNAGTLIKIAGAVGILAMSLGLISSIDAPKMESALSGITVLFMELLAGMALLLKIAAGSNLKGFWSVSTALVTFSTGILILSAAMKSLSGLSWSEVAVGLTSVAGLMVTLAAASKLLAKNSGGMIRTATGLVIFSLAIRSLVGAVKALGQLDVETLAKGLTSVGVLMAELAVFMVASSFSGLGLKTATSILILAGALNVLATAVDAFGGMNQGALIQGLAGVGAMLLEITAFLKLCGNGSKILSTSVGLIALAAALNLMDNAVASMGSLSLETIGKGLLGLAGSLAIMAGAVALIPGGALIATSVGIGLMSAALMILSTALQSMGGMSWEEIGKSLVTLAGSLTILATAMAFMTTGLAGAAAMMVMSAALMMFIPQLIALSQLSLEQVGVGLLGLAGAFTVLGLAGLLLAPLTPVLMGLAGAVALLGAGMAAAGLGVSLFAAGLATLATVGVAGGYALAEVFRQLIQLIPELGSKMAEGLTNFITSIGQAMPQIVTAITQMITGLLDAFNQCLPKIADSGMRLITTLCNTLSKAIPQLITVGINLILALLQGIGQNIGRFVKEGTTIVVNFINGIASNMGRILQAGINLVNALANSIRSNSGKMTSAAINLVLALVTALGNAVGQLTASGGKLVRAFVTGFLQGRSQAQQAGKSAADSAKNGANGGVGGFRSVGSNMIKGLIGGIKSMARAAWDAAKGVVKGALNAAKSALGIHSPSRKFIEVGKFSILGLAKGFKDNATIVHDGAREVANDAIRSMSTPLQNMARLINGRIDATPKIRPVMDLTDVTKGTRRLKDMMAENNGFSIDASVAGGISKTIKGVQNGNDNSDLLSAIKDLKGALAGKGGNTYQLNGITYDDGSNVSNAIEQLVHAANIERRK